jgi:hypothetical protein
MKPRVGFSNRGKAEVRNRNRGFFFYQHRGRNTAFPIKVERASIRKFSNLWNAESGKPGQKNVFFGKKVCATTTTTT